MATKKAVVHPIDPFLFDGPSFQNFVFHLKSSSNAPNHILTITSQTSVNTNFAFIQGTWQGDGPTRSKSRDRSPMGRFPLPRRGQMEWGVRTLL
jgi:hypothetical protein